MSWDFGRGRRRSERRDLDVLDERARIAREFHDVLAHSLGALGIQIEAARAVLAVEGDRERTLLMLDQAQRLAADGLAETHRAVHALRVASGPLPEVLAEIAIAHRLLHEATITLRVDGAPRQVAPEAVSVLARAAQEALVNSAKHAPREAVDLHLDYGGGKVMLTATNALAASPSPAGPGAVGAGCGYGLIGMRERLALVGGTLSAGPDRGSWVVAAQVPSGRMRHSRP
ncbi:MAG: hypothetical protein JWQ18_816 [Conexibacter sp.]|nr:hypothetical protein [Conexibacter sp.]